MGDFDHTAPKLNSPIITSTLKLFDDARALGKVSDDYKINTTFAGGHAFLEIIKTWDHYQKENRSNLDEFNSESTQNLLNKSLN
jgi:hypothetical protein